MCSVRCVDNKEDYIYFAYKNSNQFKLPNMNSLDINVLQKIFKFGDCFDGWFQLFALYLSFILFCTINTLYNGSEIK